MSCLERLKPRAFATALALAVLASAGCTPPPPRDPHGEFFRAGMIGVRPLVHLDRSDLNEDLELNGVGFDVSAMAGAGLAVTISFSHAPMEEEHSGLDVDSYWIDAGVGVGGAVPLGDDAGFLLHVTVGPSMLLMDFERADHDTVAVGAFGRGGVGLLWGRVGLEIYGDLHSWIGTDFDGIEAAWAASLGANLVVAF